MSDDIREDLHVELCPCSKEVFLAQKPTLQERWKTLQPGEDVQRDLYSAFLLSNLDPSNLIDRSQCAAGYPKFKSMHDAVIQTLQREKTSGRHFPSCMGI